LTFTIPRRDTKPFARELVRRSSLKTMSVPGAAPRSTAVADLIYRMGVAVNLDFGSYAYGGSSASVEAPPWLWP